MWILDSEGDFLEGELFPCSIGAMGMLIILFAIQENVCGCVLGRSISLGGSSKKEVSSHCCIAYYNA